MDTRDSEDRISWWRCGFSALEMERAYQRHVQPIVTRQLKIALLIWAFLLLLFAVPDYQALGLTRPFFILTAYRLIIVVALFIQIVLIKPSSDMFKASYSVMLIALAGFTGFMLLFVYRPDITYWIIGVIMVQLMGLLMFIPIRFSLAFIVACYGVVITLLTRWIMGTSREDLIGVFFLLMLPVVLGAATTIRLGLLQRREFSMLTKTEKINQELQEEIKQRRDLEAALKKLAATDPLTGLYNRREYEMLMRHELERARRGDMPLCICIIDLDYFKEVNDTYGHGVGDEVLRRTAELFRLNLRAMDILGRFGGEEFIALLPEANIEQGVAIGERLLKELSTAHIETAAAVIAITATIGITQRQPADRELNDIIQRADKALYQGKAAGRNLVQAVSG